MANHNDTKIDISVVVPVYNSAPMLEELFARLSKTLDDLGLEFEVIFVSDGSKDGSWEVLQGLHRSFPEKVIAIELSRNYGQHQATLCGVAHCKGDFVITIDDDMQTPPEEVEKLWKRYQETQAAIVYGIYPEKKHSFLRNLGSRMLKWIFSYQSGGLKDGSSFRLIRGDIARAISGHRHQFVFIDQLLVWHTLDFAFVKVNHQVREVGRSGYNPWKLIRMSLKLLIHYTDIPLRIMKYIGLLSSLGAFIVGFYYLVQKLQYGSEVELGFAALIVTISFASGLILLSLGIVGEYIGRIYHDRSGKPSFAIKQKLDANQEIRHPAEKHIQTGS